jgi:hypothetical protein
LRYGNDPDATFEQMFLIAHLVELGVRFEVSKANAMANSYEMVEFYRKYQQMWQLKANKPK